MRDIRTILSLLLYIVSLFVIPFYHISEVSSTASGCSACSAESQPRRSGINSVPPVPTNVGNYFGEKSATSNQIAITEKCEPDSPCHNPNHTHHNHHSHEHNCQLCQSTQHLTQSPRQGNSIRLDLLSVTSYALADNIIHNGFLSQSIDIRGPPIHIL